jgi:hypothetical protein
MTSEDPASPASRVRASEARKVAEGGRRMPGGVMPADAARALEVLQANGYGDSASSCIYRALIDAADQFQDK